MAILTLFLVMLAPAVFADQPDLELNALTTTSVSDVGEVAVISAHIRNLRATSAGQFKVVFDISPSSYKIVEGGLSQTISSLSGGGSAVSTIKLTFDKRTQYKITATVDVGDDVDEIKEDNNLAYSNIIVGESAMLNFVAGETKVVTSGGKEYEVKYAGSTDNVAVFEVDNKVIKLEVGDKKILADGTPFELIGLQYEGMTASIYMPDVEKVRPIMSPVILSAPSSQIKEDGKVPEVREISQITPELCGVPSEFKDKTDTALLAFWVPGEVPKWAHGKKYGKLYLEGGYWLSLKEIKGKTATIDIDGQTTTLTEGENKEINGVKVYLYKVGEGFINYCIHETPAQALKFTCTQGCITDSKCLPIGSRLVVEENPSYCDLSMELESQKGKDATCQNNYECTSNFCSDNKCVAIAEKLGLLDRIASFLKRIFGFGG